MSLKAVVPVLVPASLAKSGKWTGPILKLQVPGLAVTWGLIGPRGSVGYVTDDMAAKWDARDIDWRLQSMQNLERLSKPLAPQSISRSDGTVIGLIFNHDDAVGPSRLLLNGAIEEMFPDGYKCAIPDRAIAVAVSSRMRAAEKKELDQFLAGCYRAAKEPFIRKLFEPDLLSVK